MLSDPLFEYLSMRPSRSLIAALCMAITLPTVAVRAADEEEKTSMLLFDFSDKDSTEWAVVNDGVMGGRSEGFVEIETGRLRFSGTLVTRGGGFTSIRSPRVLDLSAFQGLELRVRGSGRTFEVELKDDQRYGWREVSRRAPFETSENWRNVRVPFDALRPTVFGQPVAAEAFDPSAVRGVGLFILDGIDGPFWLEVERIEAYSDR
jgi:hypothetical protein